MTQPSLIDLCGSRGSDELQKLLVNALRLGSWRHREDLAKSLNVSVREIRNAASHAHGEIISGQRGLKLTICATQDEINEALGRFRGQIREMTRRLAETEVAYHARLGSRRSA